MPADRIELPLDLPGYEEAVRKIERLIKIIRDLESKQHDLWKVENRIRDAVTKGSVARDAAADELRDYHTQIVETTAEINKAIRAEKEWGKAAVKARRFEEVEGDILGLGNIKDFGLSLKGIPEKDVLRELRILGQAGDLDLTFPGLTEGSPLRALNVELTDLLSLGNAIDSGAFNISFKGLDQRDDLRDMNLRLQDLLSLGDAVDSGVFDISFKGITPPTPKVDIPKPPPPKGPRTWWRDAGKDEGNRMSSLGSAASGGFWGKDFSEASGDMDEMTRSTRAHKSAADADARAISIEARRFKWMLGFVLMSVNAVKKLTSGTKIFSTVWSLLGQALGFIIDMILLPMLPFFVWIAKGLFKIGEFIRDINTAASNANPVLGALLSILEIITGVIIFDGLVKLIAGFSLLEGTAIGALAVTGTLASVLGMIAAGVTIAAIIIKVMDDTGFSDWLLRAIWKAKTLLQGIWWEIEQFIVGGIESILDLMAKIPVIGKYFDTGGDEDLEKYRNILLQYGISTAASQLPGMPATIPKQGIEQIWGGGWLPFSDGGVPSGGRIFLPSEVPDDLNPYYLLMGRYMYDEGLGEFISTPSQYQSGVTSDILSRMYPDEQTIYGNIAKGLFGTPTTQQNHYDNRTQIDNVNIYGATDFDEIMDEIDKILDKRDRDYARAHQEIYGA